jgi:hypothetical protein
MAVDLARLSLWLATLARDHEFTFLDHALKAGDSLVGLTRAQIQAVDWDPSKPSLPLFRETIEKAVTRALEGREAIRNADDGVLIAAQAARYSRVVEASHPARIVGDAVIAAHFSADKPKSREKERQEIESWAASQPVKWDRLSERSAACWKKTGWQPFHWEIEFPEVFARDNPGFDAVVGNPPFLGGALVSSAQGKAYLGWLVAAFAPSDGKSDLVAYFFRRAFEIVRNEGSLGLVATKTIRQGATRYTALESIQAMGGRTYRATRRLKWLGEAAVIVAVVHIVKDHVRRCVLDDVEVAEITSFLMPFGPNSRPNVLAANFDKISSGVNPNGEGFVFSRADAGKLIASFAAYSKYLRPYLGSNDLNGDPHAGQLG